MKISLLARVHLVCLSLIFEYHSFLPIDNIVMIYMCHSFTSSSRCSQEQLLSENIETLFRNKIYEVFKM